MIIHKIQGSCIYFLQINRLERASQKTTDATGDLIGNKIADKMTNVSRTSPQNSSEAVTNETENIRLD